MKALFKLLVLIMGLLGFSPSYADTYSIYSMYLYLYVGPMNAEIYTPYTPTFSYSASLLQSSFALSTLDTKVQVGDYFDVDLAVNDAFAGTLDGEELLGFGFNTQLTGIGGLQFLGSTINPLFDDASADLGLDAAGVAFPGLEVNAISSAFSLATLHFQALSAGNASIAVVSDLADSNQGLIFLNHAAVAIDSSLNVNISAVPLPPSAVLFLSAGLFTLIGRGKKSL
jgi:hypothetical protein